MSLDQSLAFKTKVGFNKFMKNIIKTFFKNGASFSLLITLGCSQLPLVNKTEAVSKEKIKPNAHASYESQLLIPYRSLDTSASVETIGFGSCNDQTKAQPLWGLIQKNNPELFIMMGDNVYASRPENKPILNQYIKLNENEDYKKLREKTPFLAIWDDHDYGQNDGGADNPEKEEARNIFLNYWGYLKPTLPKNQKALYHSRLIGSGKKRVQIILLDTRWDRSALLKNPEYSPEAPQTNVFPKIYLPQTDPKAQMLSAEQWAWFESELKKPAELRLIISSIQVIANDNYFEKWGNFPSEREKFFKLLEKNKIKNAVILSGDRHLSAIAQYDLKNKTKIYEITSSGLNKPSRNKEPEVDTTYIKPSFLAINFGLAKIDWAKKEVLFQIIDEKNTAQLEQVFKF